MQSTINNIFTFYNTWKLLLLFAKLSQAHMIIQLIILLPLIFCEFFVRILKKYRKYLDQNYYIKIYEILSKLLQ